MGDVARHLRALAEDIGPRPATTDTEEQAAAYIQRCFEARGLAVERQEFDAPRTYAWAYVLYGLLTIGAAVLTKFTGWPAALVALLVAVLFYLDQDTRGGLTDLMPKGPSQNIIGRKPSNARRGEVVRKVVVVAHYDSARASLAFHPSMVKNVYVSLKLMQASTYAVAALALLRAFGPGFLRADWSWYVALAVSAYHLFPIVIHVHREIFMPFVDGANDNASGVAAMLGVLETAVPEEVEPLDTVAMRAAVAEETGAVPEGAGVRTPVGEVTAPEADSEVGGPRRADESWVDEAQAGEGMLQYAPAGPLDDDFAEAFASEETEAWGGPAPVHDAQERFDVDEETAPWPAPSAGRAKDTVSVFDREDVGEEEAGGPPSAGGDVVEAEEPEEDFPEERPKRRWFRRKKSEEAPADWLGIDSDFDVREEGKRIGSWEALDEDEGDDDSGWLGGAAGLGDIDDPDFPAAEAARIRRRFTKDTDPGLAEKEIWFVATGAEEVGTVGMKAFLDEYGEELRDAVFINIDNVGAGNVSWVTREGMARLYRSDRRLQSAAKRVARENEWRIKGTDYKGLSTDATPALARGFRAMSVMAFDINGKLLNWHWPTDTVENVSADVVERAAEFVAAIIREL
ncbi:MAG: hypothetical protein Kow0056_12370 [Coriobacteriia bacterium]